MPAAAAPTAMAGPLALPAADLTVPTTPFPLPLPLPLLELPPDRDAVERPFDDVDAALERPFEDVDREVFAFEPLDVERFVPVERLAVVRDAVALLRVLAVFGRLFFAVPVDFLAVVVGFLVVELVRFVPEPVFFVSATGSYPRGAIGLVTRALPRTSAG
jgi:hypothetical protein